MNKFNSSIYFALAFAIIALIIQLIAKHYTGGQGYSIIILRTLLIVATGTVLMYTMLSVSQAENQTAIDNLKSKQEVTNTAGANLVQGINSIGGIIVVSKEEINFLPHSVNFGSKQPIKIPKSNIESAELYNTFFVIPNGVKVTTKDNQTYKFIVNGRKQILQDILAK